MLEPRSPIAGLSVDYAAVRIGEVFGWSLIQLAAFAATRTAAEKAMTSVLGKKPPGTIGKTAAAGDTLLFRTGPEQVWLLGGAASDLAEKLAAVIGPEYGAITDLSHSRCRIFLEGPKAREVLAKGIPLDLDPTHFRAGQFALTGLHHTPVLLYRSDADRYEIWPMRTFARSIWDWLADAALPYAS